MSRLKITYDKEIVSKLMSKLSFYLIILTGSSWTIVSNAFLVLITN